MYSYFMHCFGVFMSGLAYPAICLYAVGFSIRAVFALFTARPCGGSE